MRSSSSRAHSPRSKRSGPAAALRAVPPPQPSAPGAPSTNAPSRLKVGEPTGREISFGVEEIIVSKTDLKGHITYVNDVFERVSGFTEDEIVGQAHNVIRHPEMPRAIYQLLWKTIQSGKEIFAYVANLTKSGDHYWVLAHVTPTFDEQGNVMGYHSNRRYPDPGSVAKAKALYERLLAEERGHPRRADAIAASSSLLERTLQDLKLSYDEFVFSL